MKNTVKILYMLDKEGIQPIDTALRKSRIGFESQAAGTKENFLLSIDQFSPDLILSGVKTGDFSALEALRILKGQKKGIPLILISDDLPIEKTVEIIKAGAADYVRAGNLERLPVAIHSVLEKRQLESERQEYIAKLEQAETRFRALIEHAVDAVVILDRDGRPTYASPSIERVLGYTEQETLDLSLYTVVHPDDLPLVREHMQECLKNPGISMPVIQCRCRHKSGNWVWYEGSVTNMLDDPAINGIVDNFHEITDKKNAELELKKSEQKYRTFFESSRDAILMTVSEGKIVAANPAACAMFQMTEKELCSQGINGLRLAAGDSRERNRTEKLEGRLTFCRKDGSLFSGEITSAAFNEDPAGSHASMIIRDISERVKAEAELTLSQQNYKFLFEYSTSPKWVFDLETDQILDVNETAVKTYGYSREEFLRMKTRELKPPDELGRVAETLKNIRDLNGLLRFGIFTQIKKDGTRIKAEVSGHKCSFMGRNCMVIDSFDVTEREKILEQLKDSQAKLMTAQKIARLGYWKLSLPDFKIFWSDEIYHMAGVSKETYRPTFDDLLALIHPDDRDRYYSTREETYGKLSDHEAEYRVVLADGTVKWIHEVGKFIKDDEGNPLFLEGTVQDITTQKLLELSLEESNLRYEMVSRATSDAIWAWDFISGNAFWGEGFQSIFGYARGQMELENEFWESNIHPEDREKVLANLRGAIEGNQSNWSMEYRFRKADNTYAHVIDKGLFSRDVNGKALKLAGGMRDITERKVLQDLLDKANVLARIGSFEYNILKGGTMYWSDITKEIHEVDSDYVLTEEKIPDFYRTRADLELITQAFAQAVGKGTPFDVEVQIITARGNNRWIRVIGETEFVDGECARVYGSVQDIDQRKKADEALRLSNERYTIAAKATNDSIWDWDLETNTVERPDKTLESLLGYNIISPVEVDGFWQNHVHPEDWIRIVADRNALFENPDENYWEDEYRFLKPDATYAIVYDRGYVMRDKHGKPIKMIGASRDISKLKENEIQLKKLNEELEIRARELVASNQELEQFAYVASHDLQEPLRMVTNFLTQLEKKYHDLLDEKGKTYIHFAVDGAKRMRQMILDLLEFSRAGRNVDQQQQVNLGLLVEEILSLHQKQIEETRATIHTGPLPTLPISRSGIRQVLQNLVSNALKYNQLKKGILPHISIEAADREDHWQFEVRDNGIGIEQQYAEKIFVIFQRLHDRSEYSGTGIGLAITKKIVENLGGKIWLESEVGSGTSFFFTIPKKPEATPAILLLPDAQLQ